MNIMHPDKVWPQISQYRNFGNNEAFPSLFEVLCLLFFFRLRYSAAYRCVLVTNSIPNKSAVYCIKNQLKPLDHVQYLS